MMCTSIPASAAARVTLRTIDPPPKSLEPAPLTGTDYQLGDLPLAGEIDDGLGRVVRLEFGPVSSDVGAELAQAGQLFLVRATPPVDDVHMHRVEVGLDARRHAGRLAG